MSKSIDPLVIEIAAIRLFCEPRIPLEADEETRTASVAVAEGEWRAPATAELRDQFRAKAKLFLELISADGVSFRSTQRTETALQKAITIPAHSAYELPKLQAEDADVPEAPPAITDPPAL